MSALRRMPERPYRAARAHLGVNGAHGLALELGPLDLLLPRERAELAGDALAAVPDRHSLALLAIVVPGLSGEDLQFLRRAVAAFEEELAFEDRRPEPRSHKATKILRV